MIVFIRNMLQLLVAANVVPSSLILVTLMMEAIRIPEDGILRNIYLFASGLLSQLRATDGQRCSTEITRPGCEDNYSPLSSAEVQNSGTIPSISHTPWSDNCAQGLCHSRRSFPEGNTAVALS
jgi:hypothetical protein